MQRRGTGNQYSLNLPSSLTHGSAGSLGTRRGAWLGAISPFLLHADMLWTGRSIKGPALTRFRGWVSGPPATPSRQALITLYYNDGLVDQ